MRHPPPLPLWHASSGPAGLRTIRDVCVNLAVWRRGSRGLPAKPLLAAVPFTARGEGVPAVAVDRALRALPCRPPRRAAALLRAEARRFVRLTGACRIALRLDGLEDDACRKFHADQVGVRLLWTWAGRGTEYIPAGERRIRRLSAGDIALLKGEAWPGQRGRGAIHRSPPVAHLPRRRRRRVLVVMDTLDP